MEYSNTFIVEINHPSVRGTLAKHGKPGKPQSLNTIIIFKTNLTKEVVATLAGVVTVEEESFDTPFEIGVQSRPLNWFLPSASDTMPDYHYAKTGAGVAIYIMDSGIRLDHKDFVGRHIETVFSYDGLDYGGDVDGPDHGTMAASCAAGNEHGIAKGANIYNLRYNWSSTEGIKALDAMLTHHMTHTMSSVLSMSFSSTSNIYSSVFATLANRGIVLVAAAGNYNEPFPRFPAMRSDVIAVAACDSNLYPSIWGGGQATNYGKEIDIWAGGTGGVAASITSATATQWAGGTSSACPLVAGNVALILEGYDKLINYQEVMDTKAVLIEGSRKDVIKYDDPKYNETPNRYIYTLSAPKAPPPMPPDVEPVPTPDPTPVPIDDIEPWFEPIDTDEKSDTMPLILIGIGIAIVALLVLL
jgi:hypothetical protein